MNAPDCAPVLRAINSAALLPLLDHDDAMILAGPAALVAAEVDLDPDTAMSVARTLHRNAGTLEPILASMGLDLPSVAPMVPRAPSKAAPVRRPVVKLRADGRIRIDNTNMDHYEVVKAIPGVRWSKTPEYRPNHWHVPGSPASAANVLESLAIFDPRVSNGVRELQAQHERNAAARRLFVDGGHIPDDNGADVVDAELWDHQRVALGYGTESNALLLAIPMSGGKTITSIATINRRGCSTVLIVCPNKVRGVWPREVRERSRVGWHIEDGTRPMRIERNGRIDLKLPERLERCERVLWDCTCPAPVHAFVVNYDALSSPSWRRWTPPHKLDAIIYDEVHKLKSGPGAVSKAAARLVDFSAFRLGLSGTPMPQTPLDAYGVMRALDPGVFPGTWTEFKEKYAVMHTNGRTGQQFPDMHRVQNQEDLARRFLSITYLPVVDLKLPAVTDQVRKVWLEPKARKVYDDLDSALFADLSTFARGGGTLDADALATLESEEDPEALDGAEITTPNILTRMLRLQQLTGGTLTTDPQRDEEGAVIAPGVPVRVSTAKAEMLAEVLEEIGCTKAAAATDAGAEPVVVFCRFRSDLDAVREVAEADGLRYAEISGRRGDGLNADSRMTPDADVVGVQIQAGGTGVDLTRARYGIWYSLGYSVSDYDQARARLVRTNQARPVAFIHLIAENTADQAVYDAIDDRRALISAVLRSREIDPALLGYEEPTPGPRMDSPTGAPVSVAVKLPWDS